MTLVFPKNNSNTLSLNIIQDKRLDYQASIMCQAQVVPMAFQATKGILGSQGIFILDSQV